jgi:O-antigen/teichoic acid export membrane protein
VTVACGLWLTAKAELLTSFSVFLILALGWVVTGVSSAGKLGLEHTDSSFLDSEPGYWREHWKYSRWILAAALVFQCATQGYYWLVAGFLSVKQVAELRALSLVVAPVDQLFIALSFLVLPALAARYASGNRHGFFSLVRRYGFGVLSTTLLFVLAIRVAGRPALHLLYAGKFDDLAPLLYLLAFLPVIMGVGNALNDALKAVEQPKVVFFAYLCSAAATFVGGIPLVIRFHLPGAVYGMLLSAAAYTLALVLGFFLVVYRRSRAAVVTSM